MKNSKGKIIYSINADDVQKVSEELFNRKLSAAEVEIIEREIGDYIDWYGAIEETIKNKLDKTNIK